MDDPYSMDVLNLYVAPKGSPTGDYSSLIAEIKKMTKHSTEVTPTVTIIAFEQLLEKAGGMKFMEISDVRPKPA